MIYQLGETRLPRPQGSDSGASKVESRKPESINGVHWTRPYHSSLGTRKPAVPGSWHPPVRNNFPKLILRFLREDFFFAGIPVIDCVEGQLESI